MRSPSPLVLRLLAASLAALAGSCQLLIGVDDTDPRALTVEVRADALPGPVTVHLQAGGIDETLVVSADGSARFEALIARGHLYAVSLDNAPTCALAETASGVADADVVIGLACAGATRLDALTLDTLTGAQPALAAGQLAYATTVSELQLATRVTATPHSALATISIQGQAVTSGTPSGPIDLSPGGNTVTIVVDHPVSPSLRTTYTLAVSRTKPLAHAFYGKAFPTTSDLLGVSLATDGTRIITGAVHDSTATDPSNLTDISQPSSGAAHIFVRQGATWVREASLKAPNAEGTTLFTDGDRFGYGVGISGDFAVIGAPFEDSGSTNLADNSLHDAGAAYVFRRNGSAWVFEQYLKSSTPLAGGNFGITVAIDGDTIVIGAPQEHGPVDTGGGQVHVFRRVGTTWVHEQTLGANALTADGDNVGFAVAISGDTIAASAIAGHPTVAGAGSVRVFRRTGTTWAAEADLVPTTSFANDFFGASVAIDGTTLVVSALMPIAGTGAGAAYVFERGATGWTQVGKLVASNANDNDFFGRGVAIAGDLIAVGADREDGAGVGIVDPPDTANGSAESGAIYLYRRAASGAWPATESRYIKSPSPTAGDQLGSSVALGRDFLVAGAVGEDSSSSTSVNEGASNAGAFYVLQ